MASKKVLIIYYSYSSQTRKVIQAFSSGLEEGGVEIQWLQLKPIEKIAFPLGSVASTFKMMLETFFRKRIKIEPLLINDIAQFDLVILAGPTWSYNPSGPMLNFFDDYGKVLANSTVVPFISCRGYWRLHYYQLRYMLQKRKAEVLNPLVFLHTGPEPWRTIGVFLKLAGKVPESGKSWISKYYQKFGHTREQIDYAQKLGIRFGSLMEEPDKLRKFQIEAVREV